MRRFISIVVLIAFSQVACYNTYYITRDELKKLEHSENASKVVKDKEGKPIEVKETTRLFVRSLGGKKYRITPFNFKLTSHQLVASDRDYILDVRQLRPDAEIEVPNWWLNALWIGGGVVAIAGLITAFALTSGSK